MVASCCKHLMLTGFQHAIPTGSATFEKEKMIIQKNYQFFVRYPLSSGDSRNGP
jgi:hypothetical protein